MENKTAVITVAGFFPQKKHAVNTGEMKGLKTDSDEKKEIQTENGFVGGQG